MTKKTTKTTFRMNGWIYTYNEIRINKRQMQQLLKERDAFKMAYTEI